MSSRFYYDADTDDVIISNKLDDEKVKKNYIFDDFVISVAGSGKIVGLEIRDVSKFLKDSGLDLGFFKDIKEVELVIVPKRDSIGIYIYLTIFCKEGTFERRIPITHLPAEIVASN
ncbi:hypothetical protein J4233_04735 [Candidatus Pacearchaeota archaeon]|nr:hypothetical protein [Candidatus Pacearchaeota archaeon]